MKRIAMVMVCVLMCSFMGVVSFAKSNDPNVPVPYWDYVGGVHSGIGIYGNKAKVAGHVYADFPDVEIKMALTLQKNVNGTWKRVAAWNGSDIGYCELRKEATIEYGYDYRVVVNATIYDANGDFLETCSDTSYTVSA